MYSFILMTAMTASPQTPEFHGYFRELFSRGMSCRGSCGGCRGETGGCTGSRSAGGCSGERPARAFAGNSCHGSCTGRVAAGGTCSGMPGSSCGGSVSYSCNGSMPAGPMMTPGVYDGGYAAPSATSYYLPADLGSCFGNGGAPFQFPQSYPQGGEFAPPSAAVPQAGGPPESIDYPAGTRNFRPAQTPTAGDASRATVVVRLPFDALLYAEGRPLALTSEVRRFVSPPLPQGREFGYTFRVEYTRNGEVITRSKSVTVRAGQTSSVEFDDALAAKPTTPSPLLARPAATVPPVPAPAPSSLQTATPARARITVTLAPGAVLYVDGRRNDRTETTREFTTPPLPPGREYAYMMKVETSRNGQVETHTTKVPFQAGEIVTMDLSRAPGDQRAGR